MELAGMDEWVLLALVALKDDAYGVSIHDRLHEAGMRASLGAIYLTLERLERRGAVRSELGEPTTSRGGRRKRLFRITPRGRKALAQSQAIRNRLSALQEKTV